MDAICVEFALSLWVSLRYSDFYSFDVLVDRNIIYSMLTTVYMGGGGIGVELLGIWERIGCKEISWGMGLLSELS